MEFAADEKDNNSNSEQNPEEDTVEQSVGCMECDFGPDEANEAVAPIDRIVVPADVVDFTEEDEVIYIVGTRGGKVTRINGLQKMTKLKELTLRSCLVSSMQGLQNCTELRKLELYDNQVEWISSIDRLSKLVILDLSFNCVREIKGLQTCPLLEEFYIAQNKLRTLENLDALTHLRVLDAGANRIRVIEGLENCVNLQSLWLGKNKIEAITGLETLRKLRQLDIQSNRLTSLGDGLRGLFSLAELYLAHNAIADIDGLPDHAPLTTLDLSSNRVAQVAGLERFTLLEELWMSSCGVEKLEDIASLQHLSNLQTLYLEHNPIAKSPTYRQDIATFLPRLTCIDATEVDRRR